MTDHFLQSKPWLFDRTKYEIELNELNYILFSWRFEKESISKYINQLINNPTKLGEIKTSQQFVTILGHWAAMLNENKRGDANLFKFFMVLKNHYSSLKFNGVYGDINCLDDILLLACKFPYKKISVFESEDKKKQDIVNQAFYDIAQLFSDEKMIIEFLANCPEAIAHLAPETLQALSRKYFSIAKMILANPILAKKVGFNVTRELFENNPEKLVQLLNAIPHPEIFLTDNYNWITGAHLLEIMPILMKKPSPQNRADYLSGYLHGKKDARGKKPIQKLKEKIISVIGEKNSAENNAKVIPILKNNDLRGWVNLSGSEWVNWTAYSGYNPSVCLLASKGRELYAKTKTLSPGALELHIKRSPYLKAHFTLQKGIEITDGGFWNRNSIKLDNYFASAKQPEKLNQLTPEACILIATNHRYWKRMRPAPAEMKYIFFGDWSRSPYQVTQEEILLAKKHPIFARKLLKEILSLPKTPNQYSWEWEPKYFVELVQPLFCNPNDPLLKSAKDELIRRFLSYGREDHRSFYDKHCKNKGDDPFSVWAKSVSVEYRKKRGPDIEDFYGTYDEHKNVMEDHKYKMKVQAIKIKETNEKVKKQILEWKQEDAEMKKYAMTYKEYLRDAKAYNETLQLWKKSLEKRNSYFHHLTAMVSNTISATALSADTDQKKQSMPVEVCYDQKIDSRPKALMVYSSNDAKKSWHKAYAFDRKNTNTSAKHADFKVPSGKLKRPYTLAEQTYCLGFASAWFKVNPISQLKTEDIDLARVKDLIGLAEKGTDYLENQRHYDQARSDMVKNLKINIKVWEEKVLGAVGTLSTSPRIIHDSIKDRVNLLQQVLMYFNDYKSVYLNIYVDADTDAKKLSEVAFIAGFENGKDTRNFLESYLKERNRLVVECRLRETYPEFYAATDEQDRLIDERNSTWAEYNKSVAEKSAVYNELMKTNEENSALKLETSKIDAENKKELDFLRKMIQKVLSQFQSDQKTESTIATTLSNTLVVLSTFYKDEKESIPTAATQRDNSPILIAPINPGTGLFASSPSVMPVASHGVASTVAQSLDKAGNKSADSAVSSSSQSMSSSPPL